MKRKNQAESDTGQPKVKLSLTPEEEEVVVKEISERLKDTVYMLAEVRARELVARIQEMEYDLGTRITVTYEIYLSVAELMQIVGRHRRKLDG
jgi:hypothetical protein